MSSPWSWAGSTWCLLHSVSSSSSLTASCSPPETSELHQSSCSLTLWVLRLKLRTDRVNVLWMFCRCSAVYRDNRWTALSYKLEGLQRDSSWICSVSRVLLPKHRRQRRMRALHAETGRISCKRTKSRDRLSEAEWDRTSATKPNTWFNGWCFYLLPHLNLSDRWTRPYGNRLHRWLLQKQSEHVAQFLCELRLNDLLTATPHIPSTNQPPSSLLTLHVWIKSVLVHLCSRSYLCVCVCVFVTSVESYKFNWDVRSYDGPAPQRTDPLPALKITSINMSAANMHIWLLLLLYVYI